VACGGDLPLSRPFELDATSGILETFRALPSVGVLLVISPFNSLVHYDRTSKQVLQ
jgi:hypothetical protein